ncbi:bifunctional urea carboxylase/allophanate hydrolase [Sugiyamaella lignohabitans]|uniref:Bifunctional urea carboxylase/allophanate hydrolase n=1 Tax=Sugiyamaella lignohabitans TaxID=796027 RepID=A0A161HJ91_9ASCO|nr:bifunctional urea carboxylase/allophanate hydrolase [Sugiyamaella lignohabitans]ANB12757.1 bifunctional urea carboxylase/allophanate hydrolase [Sugiyamaella lignohabitans]
MNRLTSNGVKVAVSRRSARLFSTSGSQKNTTNIIPKPLKSLCVANRGEIVHRVHRTASRLGIKTSSVYTGPDRDLPSSISTPINLSLGSETSGYIDIERVVQTAKKNGCDSIHPGYGFLSENAQFAKRVREEGLVFVGPPQGAIEAMGAKDKSKEIMEAAGVPCVPGYHGSNQDPQFLKEKAGEIGYPVLIKAVLGGGGKGMRIVQSAEEFDQQLNSAKSEAKSSFGDDNVLIEKYITTPRHIEVQVFADKYGNTVALGERDCSVQRRHQKVLEESPAPGISEEIRQSLWEKARLAAKAVAYEGAGTVEFIFDNDTNKFYFMEMNTRLQVEHPVTEMVCGEDLVEWQLLIAAGFPLPKKQEEVQLSGHSFEARIYCEDPFKEFLPSSGKIVHMSLPSTGSPRIDFTFKEGSDISALYDPMIGKLIVHGKDREEALAKMYMALGELEVVGPTTNIEFLRRIVGSTQFGSNNPDGLETGFIPKNRDHLLQIKETPSAVYAQAAVATLLSETSAQGPFSMSPSRGGLSRAIEFRDHRADPESPNVRIDIQQIDDTQFLYSQDGGPQTKVSLARYDPESKALRIEFEDYAQFNNTVVIDPETHTVNVFQDGTQYTLQQPKPEWLAKALGIKEDKHSVIAPMPCAIAKVHVAPGDSVQKDQELVVILSMKMETTIRSPRDGVIKSVTHGVGDIVKQGVALIEFED